MEQLVTDSGCGYGLARPYGTLKNHAKGFGVSLLLHGMAAAFVLSSMPGSLPEQQEPPAMSVSIVSLDSRREGGSRPGFVHGPLLSPPKQSVSKPEPERPRNPEPPKPASPKPEPAAAKKRVPSPKPPRTAAIPDPVPQTVSRPERSPSGNAGETAATAGGTPDGRGNGEGGGSGVKSGLAQGYITANFNTILTRIRRNLLYPDYARRAKLTGTARFAFVIKEDGAIESLRLEESSGHAELDEAAAKAIKRAAPFPDPPIPALLVVPIEFRLG